MRTTDPMLKSWPQFSTATWNGCRRAVQVGADRLDRPVAVPVDHVAAVAAGEQLGVVPRVVRPRPHPRPHADLDDGLVGFGHASPLPTPPYAVPMPGPSVPSTLVALSAVSLFNPDQLLASVGLVGLLAIVFAECGLLVGFFLPGDTLLFAAGVLIRNDSKVLPTTWRWSACSSRSPRSPATWSATASAAAPAPRSSAVPTRACSSPSTSSAPATSSPGTVRSPSCWAGSSPSCARSSRSWPAPVAWTGGGTCSTPSSAGRCGAPASSCSGTGWGRSPSSRTTSS